MFSFGVVPSVADVVIVVIVFMMLCFKVTVHHVHALTGDTGMHFSDCDVGLLKPHKVGKRLSGELAAAFAVPGPFTTSRDAHCSRLDRCSKADVVLLEQDGQRAVGQVVGHFSFTSAAEVLFVTCIAVWDIVSQTERAIKCKRSSVHRFVHTRDIICSLAWAGKGDVVTVLLPLHRVGAAST